MSNIYQLVEDFEVACFPHMEPEEYLENLPIKAIDILKNVSMVLRRSFPLFVPDFGPKNVLEGSSDISKSGKSILETRIKRHL